MIYEDDTIYYAKVNTTAPDWRWDSLLNHWEGWLLWYVSDGDGLIEYCGDGGARYKVGPGDCFLFDMKQAHLGSARQPLTIHAVGFRASGKGPLWQHQRRLRQMRKAHALQKHIDQCVAAHRDKKSKAANLALKQALTLLAQEDAQPRLSGRDLAYATKINNYAKAIQNAPARDWSSADLINALSVGREHATRLFTQQRGIAPGAWVITCRIALAKHMLRFSSNSVREIANAVGYEDPYYFSRLFTRHCGCSPSAFRSQPWPEDQGNLRQ